MKAVSRAKFAHRIDLFPGISAAASIVGDQFTDIWLDEEMRCLEIRHERGTLKGTRRIPLEHVLSFDYVEDEKLGLRRAAPKVEAKPAEKGQRPS